MNSSSSAVQNGGRMAAPNMFIGSPPPTSSASEPSKPEGADKDASAVTTPEGEPASAKKDGAALSNGVHHGDARERKDPSLPQAVVRPQILTHVLGDFVIQESSEPFPVGRFHSNDLLPSHRHGHRNENVYKDDSEPPSKLSPLLRPRFFFFTIIKDYFGLHCHLISRSFKNV